MVCSIRSGLSADPVTNGWKRQLNRCICAVHGQNDTTDVGGLIGGQEDGGIGYLLGLGYTAERGYSVHSFEGPRRAAFSKPRSIGVSVRPGQITLTLTPAGPYSAAATRLSATTPPLVAA